MMLDSKLKVENLMNLVMQFRKVCNHPELFERRPVKSPFFFNNTFSLSKQSTNMQSNIKDVYFINKNPINYILPKLIYDEYLTEKIKISIIKKHFDIFSV